MTEKQGEPEAFAELFEEHEEEWNAAIDQFKKKHGRLPDPDKGEGFEIAMKLWKKYYG